MSAGEVGGRAAEADLDAYAALAAHQLGEATMLLRGYVALLERDVEALPPHVRHAVRGMAAGSERTQRFVDDLLDLKAAGSLDLVVEPVELDEVLARARVVLAAPLDEPGVELVAAALPRVRGSAPLLDRLLVHLLRSALASRATRSLRIEVDGRGDADEVVVEMRDDGTALSEGLAPRAFDPFARVRGRGALVGAGVSPAVCRRIVERHGGTIDVRPRQCGGAVTTFTLPRDA